MTWASHHTSEGAQELEASAAMLRLGEGMTLDARDLSLEVSDDETMILNMGPQHPSTHGVLRVMIELDGETVMRSKPVIGYLHTGMEKTGETLSYVQGATNVTRMDYLSPLYYECAYSLSVEKLLGIELPDRATWIRMLMLELNRLSSHLLFMATNGMDLGSTSMMMYGWRERELILAIFEKITGLRMNHNYIRPGGVAVDLYAGWKADTVSALDEIGTRLNEYEILLSKQPVFRNRSKGVGILTAEQALSLGITGPSLRASGVAWDLRKDEPYLAYDQVSFNVVVGSAGDVFDRYAVRLEEMRESIAIVRQILDLMPSGPVRNLDPKLTPPTRDRIDVSMEALIHHFKLFSEGYSVPAGETYVAVESPRGEVGCYLVSDGSPKPYRLHLRAPSFANLHALPVIMQGGLVADAVANISSLDPVLGEVDR